MRKIIRTLLNLIGSLLIITSLFVGICLILAARGDRYAIANLPIVKEASGILGIDINSESSPMLEEAVLVESVSYDRYAYQQLTEVQQQTYDQIYDCVINFKDKVALVTTEKDDISAAYEAVMADYGNLFWVSGYQYNTYTSNDSVIGMEFEPKYTMNQEQRDVYQVKIDAVVNEWLSGISPNASDFDKALYVFETLVKNVDYDSNSVENQNILSVFIYQSTVCQGYADAAWVMLDKLGIENTIITGTANNESHAWNLVYLDDAYYFMDVTWGNSKYLDSNNDATKRVNYAYLAMTTEEISQNHVITTGFEVPECLSNVDNYFVHQGLYYDWFGVDSIGEKLANSYQAGEEEISLKFSNRDLYSRVIDYFFAQKHISEYCKGLESVYYLLDENANVLTVKWK
ncbi:MAG: hypothetical protein K5883_07755 [Pseudobutyrivibrio sp.]|nr:hypothetical protein [Pseudobutyrivibrio sp.]